MRVLNASGLTSLTPLPNSHLVLSLEEHAFFYLF
jgi:hypothetical protein